ncbi:hypothetical protein Glove_71g41 [Diversispora epigaea]|uniref:Uncharacterized protein n=1 Tax=Diversispora epigaea TaxID=1348612 RepID=A0A397J9P5_9GLOM|nr:hypothetical protein Glove_71g41 [Diversispora epigaea]
MEEMNFKIFLKKKLKANNKKNEALITAKNNYKLAPTTATIKSLTTAVESPTTKKLKQYNYQIMQFCQVELQILTDATTTITKALATVNINANNKKNEALITAKNNYKLAPTTATIKSLTTAVESPTTKKLKQYNYQIMQFCQVELQILTDATTTITKALATVNINVRL